MILGADGLPIAGSANAGVRRVLSERISVFYGSNNMPYDRPLTSVKFNSGSLIDTLIKPRDAFWHFQCDIKNISFYSGDLYLGIFGNFSGEDYLSYRVLRSGGSNGLACSVGGNASGSYNVLTNSLTTNSIYICKNNAAVDGSYVNINRVTRVNNPETTDTIKIGYNYVYFVLSRFIAAHVCPTDITHFDYVMDLRPVMKDGVACLYDFANNKSGVEEDGFFYNIGSGEIEPIE